MAEEDPQQPQQQQQNADRSAGSFQPGLLSGLQGAEAGALQLRIKNSICKTVQSKVDNILQDVEKFTDIEKLYLYLKLPSGPISSGSSEKSDHGSVSSSRTQQMHAFNWIRNHLEEYPETSLPKQEVYDEYKSFCDNLNYHPLSAADFGKMMKNVFPNMKARRLGMRGKSKYCYSGLRKRPFVHFPCLPSLDLQQTGEGMQCDGQDSVGHLGSMKEEVRFAACDLVCEWAQKVLKRPFEAVEELARFLIDSHYISNKSLAALTIMTGEATDVKPLQTVSAFVPTADAHYFQPQTTTLSSPTVDAKQQLQRKIQRKQQEQKLLSPLPGEAPNKTTDDSSGQSDSPVSPSPQPTISIVVTAVSRPVTTHQSGQLVSPSPAGNAETKVLPINFQVVTQPVQPLKQPPRTIQNVLPSPVGERTPRQRYPQILPKPATTTAIALCSPSTMIIANNPNKNVMTTCHVSPISGVKMTPISLAPHSGNGTTSLPNATTRPASAGISSCTVSEDVLRSCQNLRSTSALPILGLMTRPEQVDTRDIDVEMEVEDIHKNRENQIASSVMMANGGMSQRAASVPIPQSKGFRALDETSSVTTEAGVNVHNNTSDTSSLNLSPSCPNMSAISTCNTSRVFGESVCAAKSFRKRSGLSPVLSPVKRAFLSPHTEEGSAGPGYGTRRPDSAPVTREMEMNMNSLLPNQVHIPGKPSFRAGGFFTVAKTQSLMQKKTTCNVIETHTSVGHPLMKQAEGHLTSDVHSMAKNSNSLGLQDIQAHSYTQTVSGPLDFLAQTSTSSELPIHADMGYFPFDDDVTQDSIVEELVQMEEQMKHNHKQEFENNVTFQGQQAVMAHNMMPTNQTTTSFYRAASSGGVSNNVQTPTPTPSSEIPGGVQSLTQESPCSCVTPITPVDSALGSSRHTPAGTPLSNCSSTVPPSPVECRNPFAFTPINSSVTSFHESVAVSSSPIKPMQRPMATHPDKTRLDWMNNSYDTNGGSLNKSHSTVGLLPSYQGLVDDHFQKPHAFAVPHARHHDSRFGRLTPISPVQQQVTGTAHSTKLEGFAVPAPLDNKASNLPASSGSFRCRSVSPAVHQRNLVGNMGTNGLNAIHQQCVSPFNSPATHEVPNIFDNNPGNIGACSVAQRSRSVPLNIMMQTEVLPMSAQQRSGKNITDVLLSKLDGDHETVRGMAINNLPSSYTARMNLTQILESENTNLIPSDSNSTCNYLNNGQMFFPVSDGRAQSASGGQHQQKAQATQQTSSLAFSGTFKDAQANGGQLVQQVAELTAGGADFPCELRMTSELSGSINDLNTLDANLLFDPSRQQGQYQSTAPEQSANQPLFQQITSDPTHSAGLEWFESKDHTTVGLMG
ncbi:DNA-binding protein RFX7-like [Corythoichthys intestinalis]|uniref:DNA-binding protein RFX7-like n=1 Tax=Corythoichthys intestinalis TaxID=161448 RepID=UPI0025A5B1DB|nr:DNA-binding protein RFX7-like [Corythoichthys intestinalis]XP_061796417.1 DNA-binding protein RFX7-like [Nerophis lumbriciformis]